MLYYITGKIDYAETLKRLQLKMILMVYVYIQRFVYEILCQI